LKTNTYQEKFQPQTYTDKNNISYTAIPEDQYGVRTYTLENGLKVYLAKNDEKPGIQTYIAVKTGSNRDPKDNTGLAHYLEHMMFKGTSKIGTANWTEEKKLLDEISDLYEKRKNSDNLEEKKEIYTKIDALSTKAATFAIPNEYDKLLSSIGATGTNAHTWLDETIYKNNIPKDELEKWLLIEKERFSELTLRLFHTELESVYEEFNRAQDNDGRLVNYALMELLFPTHPNGQQTTLGKAEHLKNPSMKAIHQYFDDFYVPNNMAIVLVGDLDYERSIQLINETFGELKPKEIINKDKIIEKPFTEKSTITVQSPTMPRLQIAWRTDSFGTDESRLSELCSQILCNNGEVGLVDINLNQKQKVLRAGAFNASFKEYGYFSMVIIPKENQTLEEGEQLLLAQIQLLKDGNFADWLLPAILNDMKMQRWKAWESANGLATTLYDNFIKDTNWEEELQEMDLYSEITKEDLVKFANDFFDENYVAVYKNQGENEDLIRVENPKITPIKINREADSEFYKEIQKIPSIPVEPVFIDFEKEILVEEIKNRTISFVENKYSEIAQVNFLFPIGKDHDNQIDIAFSLLDYLGTNTQSAEDIKAEFYKLGITHSFQVTADFTNWTLTGLEENMTNGVKLLFNFVQNLTNDEEIYQEVVETILEARAYNKKDKQKIINAISSYAKFGKNSRSLDFLSAEEMQNLTSKNLIKTIQNLLHQDYEIFFYGKKYVAFKNEIAHLIQTKSLEIPLPKIYPEPETSEKIYFAEYDMVQVEMLKIAKSATVNPYEFGKINVFNEYFGRGLSSIVFQELRESRSLAYSAYVSYNATSIKDRSNYVIAYIGTQPDKLVDANKAIKDLMENFPLLKPQFENAKSNILKQIASSRINRQNIFFKNYNQKKLGINHDLRKDIYAQISEMTLVDLENFYKTDIENINYNTALIGNYKDVIKADPTLENRMEVLSLEEIFGY
jgi:predicted Zn-dependent peptidase